MPESIFEENSGGFQITFVKESYSKEYLNQIGLNERQIKAVAYLRDAQKIANAKYQEVNNIGKSISAVELQELIDNGIINKIGRGKLTKYSLKQCCLFVRPSSDFYIKNGVISKRNLVVMPF